MNEKISYIISINILENKRCFMINPAKLLKLKSMWNTFCQNHPKFPHFLKAASAEGLKEGNIIEISITTNDGKVIASNLKLTQSDVAMLNELRNQAK